MKQKQKTKTENKNQMFEVNCFCLLLFPLENRLKKNCAYCFIDVPTHHDETLALVFEMLRKRLRVFFLIWYALILRSAQGLKIFAQRIALIDLASASSKQIMNCVCSL